MSFSAPSLIRLFQVFPIIGVLLTLGLAALLSGCSAVKLGYSNAPELGYWWLDSYLDFDDTQSLKVRADLAALQAWHRHNELPVYVSTLETLQGLVPTRVTPEQVCDVSSALRTRFQTLVDQTEPTLVALMPTFKADQLQHLARQFDKRNQKWRGEWMDGNPSQRLERRIKQLTERLEQLYGRLDTAQLAALRASGAVSAFDASVSFRETLRRQQDALQTLQQLQSAALPEIRVMAEVRALLVRSMNSPDAAFRNYQEQLTQASCKAFATLHNSSTPAQRQQVMQTLKDYTNDARALMTAGR